MLERLESRQLLAAIFYDFDSMSVKVRGTPQADDIRIVHRDHRLIVTLNDRRRVFELAKVQWIEADGLAGDDFISSEFSATRLSATGGAGRDTIIGGFGDDFLDGQDGSDRLIGNAGNDELRGGGGRDRLYGIGGHDILRGEGNDDTMLGGTGNDYAELGQKQDNFSGGEGADGIVHSYGRGQFSDVELESLRPPLLSADPLVYLGALMDRHGAIVVTAAATHFAGGYGRIFGDVSRSGTKFSAPIIGEDFGGAGTANINTDMHQYSLGKLSNGTYTFEARNGSRILSRLKIQLTDGKLIHSRANPIPFYAATVSPSPLRAN